MLPFGCALAVAPHAMAMRGVRTQLNESAALWREPALYACGDLSSAGGATGPISVFTPRDVFVYSWYRLASTVYRTDTIRDRFRLRPTSDMAGA